MEEKKVLVKKHKKGKKVKVNKKSKNNKNKGLSLFKIFVKNRIIILILILVSICSIFVIYKLNTKNIIKENNNIIYDDNLKEKSEIIGTINQGKADIVNNCILRSKKHKKNIFDPHSFNDKLQWLICFDNIPLKSRISDKLQMCDYSKEKLGVDLCVPKLKIFDDVKNLNFDDLPNEFILKTNHASGPPYFQVIKNKNKVNMKEIINKFTTALNENFAYVCYESNYYTIKPKLFAEQLLSPNSIGIHDYKFYCFNGELMFYAVNSDRNTNHYHTNFYDSNGKFLPFRVSGHYNDPNKIDIMPENIELMKKYAIKIAEDFILVRVDFYDIDGKLYLGEITFNPYGGYMYITDEKYSKLFADKLNLTNYPKNSKDYLDINMLSINETKLKIPKTNYY